jgi:hypothetical protein
MTTTTTPLGLIPCRNAQELKAAHDPATELGARFGGALFNALHDAGLLDDGQQVSACTIEELIDAASRALAQAVLTVDSPAAWADPAYDWIADACRTAAIVEVEA